MSGKGLSMSMSYVVIGVILLVTAATITLYFTGNMDVIDKITQDNIGEAERDLAQEHCLLEKSEACQEGDKWWENVEYNGKECGTFWKELEDIPRCD